MSELGEWCKCPVCHKRVQVIELTPEANNWSKRKFSCGDTSRIWLPESVIETISITDKIKKSLTVKAAYGQRFRTETNPNTRIIPCKNCGHIGTEHKFVKGYTGNHNCYFCKCPDYV